MLSVWGIYRVYEPYDFRIHVVPTVRASVRPQKDASDADDCRGSPGAGHSRTLARTATKKPPVFARKGTHRTPHACMLLPKNLEDKNGAGFAVAVFART